MLDTCHATRYCAPLHRRLTGAAYYAVTEECGLIETHEPRALLEQRRQWGEMVMAFFVDGFPLWGLVHEQTYIMRMWIRQLSPVHHVWSWRAKGARLSGIEVLMGQIGPGRFPLHRDFAVWAGRSEDCFPDCHLVGSGVKCEPSEGDRSAIDRPVTCGAVRGLDDPSHERCLDDYEADAPWAFWCWHVGGVA